MTAIERRSAACLAVPTNGRRCVHVLEAHQTRRARGRPRRGYRVRRIAGSRSFCQRGGRPHQSSSLQPLGLQRVLYRTTGGTQRAVHRQRLPLRRSDVRHRCSQGNYDAAAGVCDDCGLSGATCCDRGHPGATTSCSAGLFCQDGITCRECGADGQDQCQSANGAPFCDPGLVLATNQGNGTPLECVSSCGAIGELPCADGGCNDQDATVNPGSPLCQWRKDCGSENQGCCDQGSEFQGGNCHDGSICRYEADFPGTGSWWCRAPCGCYPD
jgi:hypothetical protein